MVQLSVMRDLSFNVYIVDLSSLFYFKLDRLNARFTELLKTSIKHFDHSNKFA